MINDIYNTELLNFVPNGGYIHSIQNKILVADIDDIPKKNKFNVRIFSEELKNIFFTENGPIRINQNQKYFDINIINKDKINYFLNLKTYIFNIAFGKDTVVEDFCFIKEINFKKKIYKNFIRFYINENDIKYGNLIFFLEAFSELPDFRYNLKCYISKEDSENFIFKFGKNKLIESIEDKLKEYKISGNLYQTKNGFRIILTDKFREIKDNSEILKNLHSDSKYINSCLIAGRYGCRLTPKLENYKVFNNSYKHLISNLSSTDISTSILENDGGIPVKFDLNKIYYKDNKENKKLEKYFSTFKNLVKIYINTEKYAVCKLIKKFNFSEENQEILKFISYHDKWTKANNKNSILI